MRKSKTAQGKLIKDKVILEMSDPANLLCEKGYGIRNKKKEIELNYTEANYLINKKKLVILDNKNNIISKNMFERKIQRKDKRHNVKLITYTNLRDKGYILKTGLKFGSDFRVYDKGQRVGKQHSKWLVYCVSEIDKLSVLDFISKNRVAHSTRKKLLLSIVDSENSVIFYEISWVRP